MKKIISVLVALVLVVGCSVLAVSAAPSPEVKDLVTIIEAKDADGNPVNVELVKLEEGVSEFKPEATDEAVIGQYTVKVEGNPKFPITIKARIAGVKTTSKIYALTQKADGTIEKITVNILEDGVVDFKLNADQKFIAFVTDKKTATSIGLSDKTGDSTTAIVMTILCLAVVGTVASAKKVKA